MKRRQTGIHEFLRSTRRRVGSGGGFGPRKGGSTSLGEAYRRGYRLSQRLATRMFTRTVTETKKKSPVKKGTDGLTTYSSFKRGYKLKSYLLPLVKTAAPQYQVIRFGRRVNSTINNYATDHMNFFDTGFFQQMYTELIPNPAFANQRMFVESINVCIEYCNSGDQICYLEIYDIGCKKDGTQDPQAAMLAGLVTMQPRITNGQSADQNITLGSLGWTPYNSSQLAQFYQIDKCTKVAIPSGHVHKHYMTFSPRTILNETRRAGGSNFFGGLSRHVLIRSRGQPVTQVDNNTVVGVGPSALDIICIARAKVKYVAANRQVGWTFGGVDLGNVITAEAMDPVNDVIDTFSST